MLPKPFWDIVWRIWNFDTNEYPNIFVLKKTIRTNVRIYSYQKKDTNMIRTNIRGGKYSNIFEYPNIQHTMIWKIWYERISEYIRIKKMIRTNIRIYSYQKKDTNMIRTNIRGRKYSNIFEYPNIRHTMFCTKVVFKKLSCTAKTCGRLIASGVRGVNPISAPKCCRGSKCLQTLTSIVNICIKLNKNINK